jgi:tetratricopeptide (TPR) repeat protein
MSKLNVNEALQLAVQHHQAGRLVEAEKFYRQILEVQPNHADALHLLGVLAGQTGHTDAAIDLIGRAVQVNPDFVEAYGNLGRVLADKGRLDEATAAYRRIVEIRPDAVAYNNLGIASRMNGRLDEAISAFSMAVRINPNYAEAYNDLGTVLKNRGRSEEAVAAYSKAIEIRPSYAEAYSNLGNALRKQGKIDQAIAEFSKAISLSPAFPDAYSNLGCALSEKGLFDEAIAACSEAVKLKPDFAEAHFFLAEALNGKLRFKEAVTEYSRAIGLKSDYFEAHASLGVALAELERFDEALASHGRAAAIMPEDPLVHEALGTILWRKRDLTPALESFRHAVALGPDLGTAWNALGTALNALGQFEQASACFRRALEVRPGLTIAYRNLAITGTQMAEAAEIERLNKLLNAPDTPITDRIPAGFALGKLLDETDRFDEAFARYAEANSLVKQVRAGEGERFDGDGLHRQVDRIIDRFSAEFFTERRGWGTTSELPVFIVGMPRSGTTLVEQIAASHAQVFGAGELREIGYIATALGSSDGHSLAEKWTADSIGRAADTHLAHLQKLGGPASRVVDKMMGNAFQLGLIAVMFPSARIIHCRRDPRDNCLSCFFQWFTKGNIFVYDLADCGRQYLETERVMAHWRKVLPLRMLEVNYEETVADQEGQSRRLIDFLGLPWDPACLNFHQTERFVLTASAWQVRQPIYTRSSGRWQHYEKHLGPLLEVLQGNTNLD